MRVISSIYLRLGMWRYAIRLIGLFNSPALTQALIHAIHLLQHPSGTSTLKSVSAGASARSANDRSGEASGVRSLPDRYTP
jgi:hypothetical protein